MLRRRDAIDDDDMSDADWPVLDMRRRAEPIRRPHSVINTAAGTETLLARLIARFSE